MQGNLSSESPALRGETTQSIYQLRSSLTGQIASESTLLSELNIFNNTTPGLPEDTITMSIFGTKPDGSPYAGTFDLNPFASPGAGDNTGTLGQMIEGLNDSLLQGGSRFGTARLENGNLIVTGVGDGDGFSVFYGESDPIYDFTGGDPIVDASGQVDSPIGGMSPLIAPITDDSGTAINNPATPLSVSHTIGAGETGLPIPFFTLKVVIY